MKLFPSTCYRIKNKINYRVSFVLNTLSVQHFETNISVDIAKNNVSKHLVFGFSLLKQLINIL